MVIGFSYFFEVYYIYLNNKYPQKTSELCHKCGSNLILIDVKIEKVDGQYGDVTTATYICSNEVCQKEKEEELSRIKKRRADLENAKKRRTESLKNRKKARKS